MTEPARKVGLEFEPGLVTRILNDTGDEPGTLPLLEFVLTELWRDRARGHMRHSTYESIGGVRGAMAARADEVVGGLPGADQEQVRRLLLHLVQPGAGTTDTRRRATLQELGTGPEPFVRELVGSRLLVTGRDETTGDETVEVAHEALIQHWGRLREWVDRDREFLMWRRRLESVLEDWEATGRDGGSLLRGVALTEAERWYAGTWLPAAPRRATDRSHRLGLGRGLQPPVGRRLDHSSSMGGALDRGLSSRRYVGGGPLRSSRRDLGRRGSGRRRGHW